jgi:hypothetical protein
LQKKYVEENLSADEVASEIGCAVSTVLKHLKKYGIPIRESGENIRLKRHLPFEKKIVGRSQLLLPLDLTKLQRAILKFKSQREIKAKVDHEKWTRHSVP